MCTFSIYAFYHKAKPALLELKVPISYQINSSSFLKVEMVTDLIFTGVNFQIGKGDLKGRLCCCANKITT